jgi:hypothetical protein
VAALGKSALDWAAKKFWKKTVEEAKSVAETMDVMREVIEERRERRHHSQHVDKERRHRS